MISERCYLCGSTKNRPLAAGYLRCRQCGLVWLRPAFWPANQKRHYSDTYYPEGYAGRKNRVGLFSYRFRLLKKYLSPPGELLEVGAASGDFLALLREAGYDVRGVELSRRAAQASEQYDLNIFQGTLEEAQFPADAFQYIVMYHVLEHVPDPGALLAEVARVMRPGGRLLIEVPNVQSIDAKVSNGLMKSILDFPHHLYAFSPRTLQDLLKRAGFRIVVEEQSIPFLIARPFRSLLSLRNRGASGSVPQEEVNGAELFLRAREISFWRRGLSRLVPGMKLTIVAQK